MTLFLLAINDIVENIELPVKCCLFADDLTIYYTGHDINITHDIIQKSLNKLQLWSLITGFKVSAARWDVSMSGLLGCIEVLL